MEICRDKTFKQIMNENVSSYLEEIENDYYIYENKVIHCINDECIKKYVDFNIYYFFSNNLIDITRNYIIGKDKIEQKEKESFSYEQKFRYLKNRLHDRSFKESRRLDKKYNNTINNLFTYYQKCTENILFRFEKRKKNVIQCINSKYCIGRNLRILDEYVKFSFDAGIHFSNRK